MDEHIVIVGGGLAGLSAGCYARAAGFRTTIVEHNLSLGGVCTAWHRGPYTIDGCIHWLTGGPFEAIYRELGIVPEVELHMLEQYATYRNPRQGVEVPITRDLHRLGAALKQISPEDAAEIERLVHAAESFPKVEPPIDAPELTHLRETFTRIWDLRSELSSFVHYRKPAGKWVDEHLESDVLKRFFLFLIPPELPMLFALFMLGYLARGWLSRPVGGTTAFRDALIANYHRLGGAQRLNATVDEILVEDGLANAVRLADGAIIDCDYVISTSSAPETVLRLLGGRYGRHEVEHRLREWKLFDPVALVSFGVANELTGVPSTLLIDDIAPFDVGDVTNERLYLRIYNDEPSVAPAGHTVVQAMLPTSYDWWATRGTRYGDAKDELAAEVSVRLGEHVPGFIGNVRAIDVATPLTFWRSARSWRGAYEGWMPRSGSLLPHVEKKVPGVDALYLAGQWVEPGGGVPMAVMSGRQAIQLLCADLDRTFCVPEFESSKPSRTEHPWGLAAVATR